MLQGLSKYVDRRHREEGQQMSSQINQLFHKVLDICDRQAEAREGLEELRADFVA